MLSSRIFIGKTLKALRQGVMNMEVEIQKNLSDLSNTEIFNSVYSKTTDFIRMFKLNGFSAIRYLTEICGLRHVVFHVINIISVICNHID